MAKKRHISIDTPSLFDDLDNPDGVQTGQKTKPDTTYVNDVFPRATEPVDFIPQEETEFDILLSETDENPAAEQEVADTETSTPVVDPIDRLLFLSLGSGSSGCCSYLGTDEEGIIIDAGIDAKKVITSLAEHGITADAVKGIILTHDHRDHVGFAYTLAKALNKKRPAERQIGIHCSPHTLKGMLLRHNISIRVKDFHTPFYLETPFKIAKFEITPFAVSHDGLNDMSFGFFITTADYTFAIATDTGTVTDGMRRYLPRAENIMIESNYDSDMLEKGRYPEYLKARIRGQKGHLCNDDCARFLAEIYSPTIKYIFLCHLSEENNTPQLARDTSFKALTEKGVVVGEGNNTFSDRDADVQLVVLPRRIPSPLFSFRHGN